MDKPRILVVEDDKDISRVMAINLRLEGMEVVEVHDGPSALREVDGGHFDCVVLDIMIPKMNGWEVLDYIKSRPETADMPVVMVTAKVGKSDQLRGLGAGAVKYITKPFSPFTLTETIRSILEPEAREEIARERKETIERLQLSTLHKISDILISAPGLDELIEGVADKLVTLFELAGCAVLLSDEEPEVYTFTGDRGWRGKGHRVRRMVVSRDVDDKLREFLSSKRRPARLDGFNGYRLGDVFPGMDKASDAYLLPLFDRNRYLGSIVIASTRELSFSSDEEDLLATIANQVAAAVSRARMHESLQEDEIIHRHLLQQTMTAQESERRRLASEIHDGVLQTLVGICYRMQSVVKRLPPDSGPGVSDDLAALVDQLNCSIKDLRRLLLGLRPPMLDDMGITAALEAHLKDFEQRNGIHADLRLPDRMPPVSKDAQINIFRIIQEALNNVEKHSGASRVKVEICADPDMLHLCIEDDGMGFSSQKHIPRLRQLGVASMRERTELLGGELNIRSEPGKGTTVILDLPCEPILEG